MYAEDFPPPPPDDAFCSVSFIQPTRLPEKVAPMSRPLTQGRTRKVELVNRQANDRYLTDWLVHPGVRTGFGSGETPGGGTVSHTQTAATVTQIDVIRLVNIENKLALQCISVCTNRAFASSAKKTPTKSGRREILQTRNGDPV